jgi:hypothetical protein
MLSRGLPNLFATYKFLIEPKTLKGFGNNSLKNDRSAHQFFSKLQKIEDFEGCVQAKTRHLTVQTLSMLGLK